MVFPDVTLQLYQMHAFLARFESSGVPWLHCCGRALIDPEDVSPIPLAIVQILGRIVYPWSRGRNHCWCRISGRRSWGIGAQQLQVVQVKKLGPLWSTGILAARMAGPCPGTHPGPTRFGCQNGGAITRGCWELGQFDPQDLLDSSPTVWSEGSSRKAAYYINLYVYIIHCAYNII